MSAISSPAPIPRGRECEIRPCVAELDHTHSGCMSSEAAEDPHRPKEAEYYDVGNSSQDLAQRAGAVESSVPNGEHHDVPQECETPQEDELQLDELTLPSSSGSAVSVPEEGADATSEETAAAHQDDRSSPWTEVGADGSLTLESNGRPPEQSPVQDSQGTPASTVTGSLPQWVPFPGVPFLPPKKPSTGEAATASTSKLPHPPWVWTGDETPHFYHPQLQPPNQPLRNLLCGAIDGAFEAAIRLALSLCTTKG